MIMAGINFEIVPMRNGRFAVLRDGRLMIPTTFSSRERAQSYVDDFVRGLRLERAMVSYERLGYR